MGAGDPGALLHAHQSSGSPSLTHLPSRRAHCLPLARRFRSAGSPPRPVFQNDVSKTVRSTSPSGGERRAVKEGRALEACEVEALERAQTERSVLMYSNTSSPLSPFRYSGSWEEVPATSILLIAVLPCGLWHERRRAGRREHSCRFALPRI